MATGCVTIKGNKQQQGARREQGCGEWEGILAHTYESDK